LSLLAGTRLAADGIEIESDGPSAFLDLRGARAELTVEGEGRVLLGVRGKKTEVRVRQGRSTLSLEI
jgi:hypothetical protein